MQSDFPGRCLIALHHDALCPSGFHNGQRFKVLVERRIVIGINGDNQFLITISQPNAAASHHAPRTWASQRLHRRPRRSSCCMNSELICMQETYHSPPPPSRTWGGTPVSVHRSHPPRGNKGEVYGHFLLRLPLLVSRPPGAASHRSKQQPGPGHLWEATPSGRRE